MAGTHIINTALKKVSIHYKDGLIKGFKICFSNCLWYYSIFDQCYLLQSDKFMNYAVIGPSFWASFTLFLFLDTAVVYYLYPQRSM